MSGRNAVVLQSGGLDSTTVLAIAQSEGYAVHALSFQYGQRHVTELDAARRIAAAAGVARRRGGGGMTCNLARWIWEHVAPALPGLCKVVVRETCTSGCVFEGPGG